MWTFGNVRRMCLAHMWTFGDVWSLAKKFADVCGRLATFGGGYVFGSLLFGDEVWRRSLATLGACGHSAMFVWRRDSANI